MQKLFIFVCIIVTGLVIWGVFFWLDTPFTQVCAGITIGLIFNIFWLFGNSQETAEYWDGTGPRWMQLINRLLYKQNSLIQSKVLKYNINKIVSLVFLLAFVFLLIYWRHDTIHWWFQLVSLIITWIAVACLVGWYFQRKFTRRDWKDL